MQTIYNIPDKVSPLSYTRSLMLLKQCQWKTSQNTDVNGVRHLGKK